MATGKQIQEAACRIKDATTNIRNAIIMLEEAKLIVVAREGELAKAKLELFKACGDHAEMNGKILGDPDTFDPICMLKD